MKGWIVFGQKRRKLQPRYLSTWNLAAISGTDGGMKRLLIYPVRCLLDPRALPENLARLIPTFVPSGLSLYTFQTTPPTP
jgi:hypothetical protein